MAAFTCKARRPERHRGIAVAPVIDKTEPSDRCVWLDAAQLVVSGRHPPAQVSPDRGLAPAVLLAPAGAALLPQRIHAHDPGQGGGREGAEAGKHSQHQSPHPGSVGRRVIHG